MSNFVERTFAAAKRSVGPNIQEPGTAVLTVDEVVFLGISAKAGQKDGITFDGLGSKQQKKLNDRRLEAFPPDDPEG